MPIRRYKPGQIVNLLRQVEVAVANGKTTPARPREEFCDTLLLHQNRSGRLSNS